MRKVILDTHFFLWWLSDDPRLSTNKRAIISASRQTVFISAISLWEMAIKESIGKLKLPKNFNFQTAIENNRFVLLPIEPAHLEKLRDLPMKHKDPFDRLLVAQAQTLKAILLTDDQKIQNYSVTTSI
jgi:PIN domain nuclease of toxin-antitoxin system